MTPAEHKEQAEGLLEAALDHHPATPVYLALVARAGVHATLALYSPPLEFTAVAELLAEPEPTSAPPEPVRPRRTRAKAPKVSEPTEDVSAS